MKFELNHNSLLIIVLVIFVGVPIILVAIAMREPGFNLDPIPSEYFIEFYERDVNGNIVEYDMHTAGVMTFRTTDPLYKTFAIWPKATKGKRFSQTVAKGDSILKTANSDFFILKKENGETYKYYFGTYSFDNK